jgi:hypothetical protein
MQSALCLHPFLSESVSHFTVLVEGRQTRRHDAYSPWRLFMRCNRYAVTQLSGSLAIQCRQVQY